MKALQVFILLLCCAGVSYSDNASVFNNIYKYYREIQQNIRQKIYQKTEKRHTKRSPYRSHTQRHSVYADKVRKNIVFYRVVTRYTELTFIDEFLFTHNGYLLYYGFTETYFGETNCREEYFYRDNYLYGYRSGNASDSYIGPITMDLAYQVLLKAYELKKNVGVYYSDLPLHYAQKY